MSDPRISFQSVNVPLRTQFFLEAGKSKTQPENEDQFTLVQDVFQAMLKGISSLVPEAHAQTTSAPALVISHQGRLLDANDNPVTGAKTITFLIYDTADRGVRLSKEQAS